MRAASVCTCNTSDGNCLFVNVPSDNDSPGGCSSSCQKEVGKTFTNSNYGIDTAGTIFSTQCRQVQSSYAAALQQKASGTPDTKSPASAPLVPLKPSLNVPIPGLSFTDANISNQTSVTSNFLATYLTGVYQYLIGISITIAVVMVIIGGFQYVLAAGSGNVKKGRKRIENAVIGLILLLCVYIILYTANPQLVLLKSLTVESVAKVDLPVDLGDVTPNAPAICKSIAECKSYCDNPSIRPISGGSAIDPSQVSVLANSEGFVNNVRARGTPLLQERLAKAGLIAKTLNPAYSIRTRGSGGGYRAISEQFTTACENLQKCVDGFVAWPGGSNHGTGAAVDVYLFQEDAQGNARNLMPADSTTQTNPKYEEPSKILQQIMTQAGFTRYCREIWHFEIKEKSSSFDRSTNCPFPPK